MSNSILDGAAFFTGLATSTLWDEVSKKTMTKAARVIRDEARRVLGTYDYGWPSLAESTIERKMTGDSPGLETGAMRASIEYEVYGERMHWNAVIGSDDPHALWFELGTIKQPPRSFLAGAATRMEPFIKHFLGHDMCRVVISHHPFEE
jgi:hypothetical protein